MINRSAGPISSLLVQSIKVAVAGWLRALVSVLMMMLLTDSARGGDGVLHAT